MSHFPLASWALGQSPTPFGRRVPHWKSQPEPYYGNKNVSGNLMLKELTSDFNTWNWMIIVFWIIFAHTLKPWNPPGVLGIFEKNTPPQQKNNDKRLAEMPSNPGWDAIALGFGHRSYAETCQCTGGTTRLANPGGPTLTRWKVLNVEGFWRNSLRKTYKTR